MHLLLLFVLRTFPTLPPSTQFLFGPGLGIRRCRRRRLVLTFHQQSDARITTCRVAAHPLIAPALRPTRLPAGPPTPSWTLTCRPGLMPPRHSRFPTAQASLPPTPISRNAIRGPTLRPRAPQTLPPWRPARPASEGIARRRHTIDAVLFLVAHADGHVVFF